MRAHAAGRRFCRSGRGTGFGHGLLAFGVVVGRWELGLVKRSMGANEGSGVIGEIYIGRVWAGLLLLLSLVCVGLDIWIWEGRASAIARAGLVVLTDRVCTKYERREEVGWFRLQKRWQYSGSTGRCGRAGALDWGGLSFFFSPAEAKKGKQRQTSFFAALHSEDCDLRG